MGGKGDDTYYISQSGSYTIIENAGEGFDAVYLQGEYTSFSVEGTEIEDIIVGTGAEVLPTSTLTVHYTLMAWSTGKIIESSWSGQPATFPLANVVEGWQKGLPGAKVGGRRLLILPPSMGYGAAGAGPTFS